MSSWESSSRRRSVQASSSRLRMDAYGSAGRSNRTRAASPPKRRELDNVMKKARRDGPTQSSYWNKKLLEVEEKDPNRWRHSGFKELYGGGGTTSPQGSRASPKRSRSRSRGRARGRRSRVRSPPVPARPRSRSRERERERDRDRERERDRERRPHTPQPQQPRPQSQPQRRGNSRRSPRPASLSASSRSLSSCSDESCSVCSPKVNRKKSVASPPARRQPSPRSRSRSFSVPRNRPAHKSPVPVRSAPKQRLRERSGVPPTDPRVPPPSPPPAVRKPPKSKRKEEREKGASKKRKPTIIKIERTGKRRRSLPLAEGSPPRRRSSPPMSGSEESSTSSVTSGGGAPKLTLSERFGKMAQWSVDRRDLDGVKNMRITKDSDSSDLKVVIEGERYRALSPMPVNDRRVGLGYFPESQHSAPVGLDAWDDVRVRYKYYKDRGYLRDLTLDDYMKWEEWWYKYQEWLEAERYYEHWAAIRADQASRGGSSKMWSESSIRKRRR